MCAYVGVWVICTSKYFEVTQSASKNSEVPKKYLEVPPKYLEVAAAGSVMKYPPYESWIWSRQIKSEQKRIIETGSENTANFEIFKYNIILKYSENYIEKYGLGSEKLF